MTQKNSCKAYNAIDLLKAVLAVFVMVIHAGIDKTVISPILRTAVPLFFIVSSCFFFQKINGLTSVGEKRRALVKLVKRNLLLYLLWSLIQLPLLFFMRGYHRYPLLQGAWYALKDILLGGGFTGAWYLVALVIGVAIVFALSRKIPSVWLVLLTLPLYVLCCFLTNYYHLFGAESVVVSLGEGYQRITGMCFYTSFPVAMFWVSVGKVIAERSWAFKTSVPAAVCAASAALLALERYLIVRGGWDATDDCYFMLILVCPAVFLLVRRSKMTLATRFPLREFSVLLYVTHGCCGRAAGYLLKKLSLPTVWHDCARLLVALLIAVLITEIVVRLKEKTKIRIFGYLC